MTLNTETLQRHIRNQHQIEPFLMNPREGMTDHHTNPDLEAMLRISKLTTDRTIELLNAGGYHYSLITPFNWHTHTETFTKISAAISQAQSAERFR